LKFFLWILAAVVTLAVTSFAVTNRAPVEIDFWPLPFTATPPLFAILITTVVVGFGFGSIATWWSGRNRRRIARARGRGIDRLKREIEVLKRTTPGAEPGRPHLPQPSADDGEAVLPTKRPAVG